MKAAFLAAAAAAAAQTASAADPTVDGIVMDNGSAGNEAVFTSLMATAPDAKYATNSRHFRVGVHSNLEDVKLSEIFPKVLSKDGKDVSALLGASYHATGSVVDMSGNDVYAVKVDGFNLPEGEYTFSREDSDVTTLFAGASTTVVIDRTAPVAKSVAFNDKVYAGAPATVAIPLGDLFSESVTIVSARALGDSAGFTLDGSDLVAASVTGPTGKTTFEIVAMDAAGNKAKAMFTIPITTKDAPTLSVYDARGTGVAATGTLHTGSSASMTDSKLVLTAVASFPDPVSGIEAADLAVTGATADSVTVASSNGGRTWTFTVTFNSNPASDVSLQVSNEAGACTADDAATAASNAVSVVVDGTAPVANTIANLPGAVAGAAYFAYLPATSELLTDAVSAATAVDVTSASSNVPLGLALTTGKQGAAYISGTPSSEPTATCGGGKGVTFTVKGKDEAGNTQQGTVCVPVAAAGGAVSLRVAKGAVSFTEGAGPVAVDASATYSGPVASSVTVYLETPDVASSGDESFDTSAYAGAGTVSAFAQNGAKVGWVKLSDTDPLTAADVQAFLRALKYTNAKAWPTSGSRTVRVVVKQVGGAVVAVGSRAVSVTSRNAAPVITGIPASVTFTEGSMGVPVLPAGFGVTDSDDEYATGATVSLATKGDGSTFGGCDTTRDMLMLASGDSATVFGTYDATSCTLSLKPLAGWAAPLADFVSALKMVKYGNADAKNPTNYGTGVTDTKRSLKVSVTDAASAGKDLPAAPKQGKVSSAATTKSDAFPLALTLTDDAPVVDLAKAFAEGGFLYSADSASRMTTWDDTSVSPTVGFKLRKFVFRMDGKTTTAQNFNLVLDLSKQADGVFGAGGAIMDPDNKDAFSAAGAGISSATAQIIGSATGLTVGTLSNADGKLTIPFSVANQATFSGSYPVKVTLATGVSPVFIVLDFLAPKCVSEIDATNAATTFASGAACYDADGASKIAATTVDPSVGATVKPGDFDARMAALEEMLAAHREAGTNASDRIVGMRQARQDARGLFSMDVPASSFAAVGNVDMNAKPPSKDILGRLPKPATGAMLDEEVTVQLSPAGQTFTKPVKVCVYVGDAPSGFKYELALTSQIDAKDDTKGYGDWSAMSEQTYDASTGLLCGLTNHFSVAGPMLVPVPQTATQQKLFAMGASCPNDCSGKGYCRETGKCVCFAGFEGYDCSMRACPAGESWDSADGVVHKPAECSARGACNAKTGACACYDGFEGAACERVSCPSSCSGHGKCRLLAELPKAQQSGYSSWEVSRVQVCQCDGGYTGADCSLRTCPHGDDPETVCVNDKRQIQTITLDFGTLPASLAGTVPGSVYDTDFALTFTTASGANYTTPRVEGIFDSANGPDHLMKALKSLPAFAVSDVAVTATGSSSSPVVSYQVTFDGSSLEYFMTPNMAAGAVAGNTVSGNQALFTCPTIAGTTYVAGCSGSACRPQFKQLRILDVAGGPDVAVHPAATLEQPAPLAAGDEAVAGKWGATVSMIVATSGAGVQTYEVTSTVYEAGAGESIAKTVMPPAGLRDNLSLMYGLHVNLAETVADGTYVFRWRLPTCTVAQTQAADPDFESLECSRRGVCDRKAGECVCFSGYSGYSCSQQTVVV